jgi:hypothetical protein
MIGDNLSFLEPTVARLAANHFGIPFNNGCIIL